MIFANILSMKKRHLRSLLSMFLVLILIVSMIPFTPVSHIYADSSRKLSDKVSIVIDEKPEKLMNFYTNGIYETTCSLASGSHIYSIIVNGSVKDKITFNISNDESLTVRYNSLTNELTDSINNADKFYTSATLTGNFSNLSCLNIDNWDPTDTDGDLNYAGGGIYRKTFTFDAPLATDTQLADGGYKIAFNHDWSSSLPDANKALIIPAGTTELTIFADCMNGKVYDSVNSGNISIYQNAGSIEKPAFTTTVSLIGSVRSNDDYNWDLSKQGFEFTQISDTLYAYSMVLDHGSYEYKAAFDYTYWYESFGGQNNSLTVDTDNTAVLFIYDTTTDKLYDTVNNYDTLSTLFLYAKAPVLNQITENPNGSYTFTMPGQESDEISLCYTTNNNTADIHAIPFTAMYENKTFQNGFQTTVNFDETATSVYYYYLINNTITYDTIHSKTTINNTLYNTFEKSSYQGRPIYVPGTFPGLSWNPASNQMTYLGNGLYSYTFKDLPPANYEFKIASGTWTENYGIDGVPGGSNYSVTVYNQGDVTIYYNDISHRAVNSLNYIFADISLTSDSNHIDTKLTDNGLTAIYSATCNLPAGTYNDFVITFNQTSFAVTPFTLDNAKEVTFYFDPSTMLYYNNASDCAIDEAAIYYDSKSTDYKAPFGAVEANQNISFSIDTGNDITAANLFIKGVETKSVAMTASDTQDGKKFSADVALGTYGKYTYYFALSNGSSVKVYCDDDGYLGTGKVTDLTDITPYELTIYKEGYSTPDWMKNAVVYQIFPDRFFDGNSSNNTTTTQSRGKLSYEYVKDWYTLPENPEQESLHSDSYPANAFRGDGNYSNEIYGGDLAGITDRIDYLKALGVNVIYLNPIFKSISNHRYDASDYSKIDPILGTLGDFEELVQTAKQNDMHIILDGVFNHVADDSIYFDRYYRYVGTNGKIGAYPYWAYVYDYMDTNNASKDDAISAANAYYRAKGITDFTYTQWFDIYHSYMKDTTDSIGERAGMSVYAYDCWWGYDSMPVIIATNGSEYQTPDWSDEIISGQDAISSYWLSEGANGWRLDVANEVSDETWINFRDSVKALNDDNVIIGEIWDTATKYLLGDMYDSVMNYVFRNAVLNYVKGGSQIDCMNTLEKLRELYPQEAFYAMMNLVGSHDTTRVLSFLDGINDDRKQTDIASAFPNYETTSETAKKLQYVVAFIQMTYAGAPTIYYGDELGMTGADDPDNRRTMDWGNGNKDLVTWYAKLAAIRSNYSALRTGVVKPVDTKNEHVLSYIRKDGSNELFVASNNSGEAQTITLSSSLFAKTSYTDLINQTLYNLTDTTEFTIIIPAYSGVILADKAVTVTINEKGLAPAYDKKYIVKRTSDNKETTDNTETSGNKETPDNKESSTDTSQTEASTINSEKTSIVSPDNNPGTGDFQNIMLLFILLLSSCCIGGISFHTHRKRNAE